MALCAGALALAGCSMAVTAGQGTPWQQETAYFSPATEIDEGNVGDLGVAWEFADFTVRGRTNRGVEATPVVADGVMYMTGPWSVVYALDAKSGKELWRYDPDVDGSFARRTCCDAVNRGVAVADGQVYVATLDGYLVSLDAKTGKPAWKVDTFTDRSKSYAITGAPRIAGRNVLIGNGGAEMGVRGYVTALDRKTGKLAWRFFVVPGDPKAGPDEHPEVTEARKTWDPNSAWDLGGGGTVWDSIVYDPDTNIVYVGTGNGSPHPAWQRSPAGGDNLYVSSILALDANTGRKKWHYQTTPKDSWDYTATQNMILADIEFGGRTRKVLMQAPKNGFFYVLDRVTGELLSAEKYTTVTWADRVDLKTGRPVFSEQGDFKNGEKLVWPSEAGGHNWPPMAFNPGTGLVYMPVLEAPMTFISTPDNNQPYSPVQGSTTSLPGVMSLFGEKVPDYPGQPKPKFEQVLKAWDPAKGKVVWTSRAMPFWSGGVMTTATGLVVQGSADGFLTVYNGRSGKVLRRIEVGTGIMAAPMSYEIDGEQYLAVPAGFGGAMNAAYLPGWAAEKRENTSRLLVFKIGAAAQPALPPLRTAMPLAPAPAQFRGTAAQVARGEQLFNRNCARCHGGADFPSGYPDLWKMGPETHAVFNDIVLDGLYAPAGMASFKDVLSPRDAADIHAYLAKPLPGSQPEPKAKNAEFN
ncbi:PQQ-dependent dehydrogenase, methanol/ethanol family [Tsuneonella sp. HG094]